MRILLVEVIKLGAKRSYERARNSITSRRSVELKDANVAGAGGEDIRNTNERAWICRCGIQAAKNIDAKGRGETGMHRCGSIVVDSYEWQ